MSREPHHPIPPSRHRAVRRTVRRDLPGPGRQRRRGSAVRAADPADRASHPGDPLDRAEPSGGRPGRAGNNRLPPEAATQRPGSARTIEGPFAPPARTDAARTDAARTPGPRGRRAAGVGSANPRRNASRNRPPRPGQAPRPPRFQGRARQAARRHRPTAATSEKSGFWPGRLRTPVSFHIRNDTGCKTAPGHRWTQAVGKPKRRFRNPASGWATRRWPEPLTSA